MAEVTSGNVTVMVMDDNETDALRQLLGKVVMTGTHEDESLLWQCRDILESLDIELTV